MGELKTLNRSAQVRVETLTREALLTIESGPIFSPRKKRGDETTGTRMFFLEKRLKDRTISSYLKHGQDAGGIGWFWVGREKIME